MYFDSFVIEYIPQKVLGNIKDKSNTHNILKIQSDQYLMFGFYSIAFIAYMSQRKALLDHINLFYPNDYRKNDKIVKENAGLLNLD